MPTSNAPKPGERGGPGLTYGFFGKGGFNPLFVQSSIDEHVAELQGDSGLRVYEKMRRSDSQIIAVLRAITLPLRQAPWSIVPPEGEKGVREKKRSREIADTLHRHLIGGKDGANGMEMPWDDVIRYCLTMLTFGFSISEVVLQYFERSNLLLPRKIDLRKPRSITGAVVRDGKIAGIKQRLIDGEVEIPVEQLLMLTNEREGELDWRGLSLLRGAYQPWLLRDDFMRINAIAHTRFSAGIPYITMPKSYGQETKEWEAAEQTMADLHANERGFLVVPFEHEVGILDRQFGHSDVLPSIFACDDWIARAMVAQVVQLATQKEGSRALAQSVGQAFLQSIKAFADYLCEVISIQLIRPLVEWNWGELDRYPRCQVTNIHEIALQQIAYLVQSGALPPNDPDVEHFLKHEVIRVPPAPEPNQEDIERAEKFRKLREAMRGPDEQQRSGGVPAGNNNGGNGDARSGDD